MQQLHLQKVFGKENLLEQTYLVKNVGRDIKQVEHLFQSPAEE